MKNVKLIRKAKYMLYGMGIHKFLPSSKLNFLGHTAGVSSWIKKYGKLHYSSFPNSDFRYDKREGLYQFVLDNEVKTDPINYLEFGVSRGTSFKWWVANHEHPESRFFGFDTFTGLPEDWGPFKKGAMSNGNEPPKIDDTRHSFYQGIFQKTLYSFLENYNPDKKQVIHLDADLYSATLFVLTTLSPHLKKGDILIFDEFNVPMHEYKAFTEWADSFYINYKPIGETNNYLQVAIRLE
ncbi:MAG: hypothetical protein Kapaf2KO_12420 [Candidatus Kapaibacteriales bacterium]